MFSRYIGADDADQLSILIKRHDIRYHIVIDISIVVRFNPCRRFPLDRNMPPSNMFDIVFRI